MPYIALRFTIIEIHSIYEPLSCIHKMPRIEQEVQVLMAALLLFRTFIAPFALCGIIALVRQASDPMHSSAFCRLLQILEGALWCPYITRDISELSFAATVC
jgi:hypothetical protein